MGPDRRPPRGRQRSRLHPGLCVWCGLPDRRRPGAPAGTTARRWRYLTTLPCWRCRLTAQSSIQSRAHLALSAQPLARQLGLSQPGRHHGCLRYGVEPLRWRPRLGPFAVRRRLGARLALDLCGRRYCPKHPGPIISGDPYKRSSTRPNGWSHANSKSGGNTALERVASRGASPEGRSPGADGTSRHAYRPIYTILYNIPIEHGKRAA